MKKLLRLLSYVVVAALAASATLFYAASSRGSTKLIELENLIVNRFIGEANQTAMEDAAAEAMIGSLGDRWSYYIPAREYADYEEQMRNSYVGIGITISMQGENGILVETVQDDSPARQAGLQPRDLIIEIEGQSTVNMTTTQARDLVRGKEGTDVALKILRGNVESSVSVTRRQLQSRVATYRMLDNNIGLIAIANFDSRCAEETIAAIEALQNEGAQKLIFDVRNNPGGYADELVKLLDYLLPEGELFRAVDYRGKEQIDTSDAACLDVPMAVLVNGNSYSAAEFFGAALMDYNAALIVGQQTCGKGYFQNTFRLSDGSAVGLSVGKYYTPSGESLANVGITPDILAEVDEEMAFAIYAGLLEPEEDPQIQAAVRALSE